MPTRPEKPLATSVDGRHFVYEVPVAELDLRVGGYVVIDDGRSGGRLGYVTSAALADGDRRHARVEGRVLEGPVAPFGDVPTRDATSDEVARWLEAVRPRRAMLGVGTLALAEGVPLELDAGAFDRHVPLRAVGLGQDLRARDDPRAAGRDVASDRRARPELGLRAPRRAAGRRAGRRACPFRARVGRNRRAPRGRGRRRAPARPLPGLRRGGARGCPPPRPRRRPRGVRGARRGRGERRHAHARHGAGDGRRPGGETGAAPGPRHAHSQPRRRSLAGVVGNDSGSLGELVQADGPRCVVADLGSLETRGEQAVAAEALLASSWRRRAAREPLLIVIDEERTTCVPRGPRTRSPSSRPSTPSASPVKGASSA